jgi:undecaprenyl-diphosphatase
MSDQLSFALCALLIRDQIMPDFFQLLVLSLLQGVTEFLPVSSSGHLVLLPFITGWADQGRGLDVAAHLGTLAAVLIWWRADIILMLSGLLSFGRKHAEGWLLFWQLVLASLPVILAGLLVHIWDPDFLRLALTVAVANLVFAGWLWWADKQPEQAPDAGQPGQPASWRAVLLIGLAQILALIPGASRSGVTISMARQLGWPRAAAARFSMLLSIPVIAGAGCLSLLDLAGQQGATSLTAALVTTLLSFVFALLAIRWLMGWLARADFRIFVIYRLVLGVLLLGFLAGGFF